MKLFDDPWPFKFFMSYAPIILMTHGSVDRPRFAISLCVAVTLFVATAAVDVALNVTNVLLKIGLLIPNALFTGVAYAINKDWADQYGDNPYSTSCMQFIATGLSGLLLMAQCALEYVLHPEVERSDKNSDAMGFRNPNKPRFTTVSKWVMQQHEANGHSFNFDPPYHGGLDTPMMGKQPPP